MKQGWFLFLMAATAAAADADYELGPDSQVREGVPRGEVRRFTLGESRVFPGTWREWALYVPRQYDGSKAACVMVFFDGLGMAAAEGPVRATVVMDNLIASKEMPVTVGVFINPGVFKGVDGGKDRSNRSYEYDSLGDANARFVIEEIVPLVEAQGVKLVADAAGWAVCGMSSGGIAAFTVAWERPERFGKVVSWIGSFTNIRGGYVYPGLIRKSRREPKALRVFLQDGSGDLDNLHGNWPLANQEMAAALKFAGYDFRFEFGSGGHSPRHGASILPDTLRWLWRDWPR